MLAINSVQHISQSVFSFKLPKYFHQDKEHHWSNVGTKKKIKFLKEALIIIISLQEFRFSWFILLQSLSNEILFTSKNTDEKLIMFLLKDFSQRSKLKKNIES